MHGILYGSRSRISEIKQYHAICSSSVEEHFREPVSLQEGAGLLGLTREYFAVF